MKRRLFNLALAGALGTAAAPRVLAQPGAYPQRPIRIVAPFAVGGIADIFSRLIAAHLQRTWGQTVVVENRTGAGGNIGADLVAKSPPDGYTLVMGNNGTHAVNPSLFQAMPYDPARDFTPVVRVVEAEGLLVVHPSLPVATVSELLALARAEPNRLSYASGGLGTTSHLAGELFKSRARVQLAHVPYKGNAEAINDVVAGHVQLAFATMPTVLPFVQANRLRAVAVIENVRSSALPNVPTIAESGVPGFDVKNWIGLFAPAGTPREIVDKVNAETIRAMRTPEVQAQLGTAGARFAPTTPAQFAQFVQDEARLWAGVVREANIRI